MQPSAIEKDSGVANFDRFGLFNTIYLLAGGDCTKYDAVFNLSYSEAYMTLARKAEEARYQKRFNEIISSRNA